MRVLSDCPAFLGQAQEGEPRCPTAELWNKHRGLGRAPSSTSSQLSKTCGLAMPRLGPAGRFSPSSSKAEANRKRSGEPGSPGRQGRGLPAGPQPGAAPHLPRHGGDAQHHPAGSPPASRSGTERLWLEAATCRKRSQSSERCWVTMLRGEKNVPTGTEEAAVSPRAGKTLPLALARSVQPGSSRQSASQAPCPRSFSPETLSACFQRTLWSKVTAG